MADDKPIIKATTPNSSKYDTKNRCIYIRS
jgi:hypothetical protein